MTSIKEELLKGYQEELEELKNE
jgi:hypothetical protein